MVEELSEHLRAVLRDTLCGHLDVDLCALADELLAQDAASASRTGSITLFTDRSLLGVPFWVPGVFCPPGTTP